MASSDCWQGWINRWDRMQERYLVARDERFQRIVDMIRATQDRVETVVDLGCGTGSLTVQLLAAFPTAIVCGIDLDPTLLPLAVKRCGPFQERAIFMEADLRSPHWVSRVPGQCQAVVSATALHWLNEAQLTSLYGQVHRVLAPGGVFLNADHAGSSNAGIQSAWERNRDRERAETPSAGEEWNAFWGAYLEYLGEDARTRREQAIGPWEGIEPGLPLAWHFDALRSAGFASVDCFRRWDCDALYGGIKG